MKALLTTIACLLYLLPVLSQQSQYPFSHLDISNGLSHNQVNCIVKGTKGKKPIILIANDNEDISFYLEDNRNMPPKTERKTKGRLLGDLCI